MKRGLLLREPEPGWAEPALAGLFPGAHVAVFGSFRVPLEAEEAGFEVRDSVTVIGPRRHQVWLLRKPIEAGNVVSQVLKTGTGGIWIDGGRVRITGKVEERETAANASIGGSRGIYGVGRPGVKENQVQRARLGLNPRYDSLGRWPTNLVLVHGPGCRRDGTKRVWASQLSQVIQRSKSVSEAIGVQTDSFCSGYADADGLETITSWVCEPGCHVSALDEQSGYSVSNDPGTTHVKADGWGMAAERRNQGYAGESGGASRFFPQFGSEAELDQWILRLILGPSGVEAT